jgi:hypothetical protein
LGVARVSDLDTIIEQKLDTIYKPNRRDRELKAAFWNAMANDPFARADDFKDRATTERYLGKALANWNSDGFCEWFFNKDEHKHKIEYLFGIALDAAEEILLNNDPKVQGARVQLIRALSELAGKVPHKQAQVLIQNNTAISGAIDNMSREQLEQYVARALPPSSSQVLPAAPPKPAAIDLGFSDPLAQPVNADPSSAAGRRT